ncbi:MAG: hypothetical protein KatS3mg014_2424 [Actinomycetota bacterium]|nr:MAG: hypothetical protein KatS3mg014_2424 [Actinomycetota bacterium]
MPTARGGRHPRDGARPVARRARHRLPRRPHARRGPRRPARRRGLDGQTGSAPDAGPASAVGRAGPTRPTRHRGAPGGEPRASPRAVRAGRGPPPGVPGPPGAPRPRRPATPRHAGRLVHARTPATGQVRPRPDHDPAHGPLRARPGRAGGGRTGGAPRRPGSGGPHRRSRRALRADGRARHRPAPVPGGGRVLHHAPVRGRGRPATDPLAERRPHRRAHDPPGRVVPPLHRRPLPGHAGVRARPGPYAGLRARGLGRRLGGRAPPAVRLHPEARHGADRATPGDAGPPPRHARGRRARPDPLPLPRPLPPAPRGRHGHRPRPRHRHPATPPSSGPSPRSDRSSARKPRSWCTPPTPIVSPPPIGPSSRGEPRPPRGRSRGRGGRSSSFPPSGRLAERWHAPKTPPLASAG